MIKSNRREFISQSYKGLIGSAALTALSQKNIYGANERMQIALIGCGGRGKLVMYNTAVEKNAEISYLCDLNQSRIDEAQEFLKKVQDRKPKTTKNMQEVLDSKDVDAVIIATPDQWHSLAAIMACQAGKDVYVEKPHSHNIWESRKLIEAARKYKRIVQVGTQNRSAPYNHEAVKYIKTGELGSIHLVKVYNLKPGGKQNPFHLGQKGRPPQGFNWDTWLGPAPDRPYYESIYNKGWHHFWDFSGGDLLNDASHQIDLALMLLNEPGMPHAVSSSGGRFLYKGDDSQVPDLLATTYDYDDFVMTLEHSNYPKYMRKTTGTIRRNDEYPYWTQNSTRIELYGSKYMMTIGRHGGGWQVTTSGGKVHKQMYGRTSDTSHIQNFLECIKSRKRSNADVEILHPGCCLLHLANIAHQVGNKKLQFDPKNEKFINNDAANKLVKRKGRKKFEIPEKV